MDTSAQTDALVSLPCDEIFALRNGAYELFVAEPLGTCKARCSGAERFFSKWAPIGSSEMPRSMRPGSRR